jgi:hypothetical protein
MSELEVTIQGTPNPHAAKFTLSRSLELDDSRSYFDAEDAEDDPLARSLFEIDGVRALLMVDNFITVTKEEDVTWEEMVDEVAGVIRRELEDGEG